MHPCLHVLVLPVKNICRFQCHFLFKTVTDGKFSKQAVRTYFFEGLKNAYVLTLMEIILTCLNNNVHIKKISSHVRAESNNKISATLTFSLYCSISLLLRKSLKDFPTGNKGSLTVLLEG